MSNTYCVVFLFSFSSHCVHYVASFSGVSFFIFPSVFSNVYLSCVLCTLCCQFFWGVLFLFSLRYSLTFICPVSCVHYVAIFSGVSFFLFSLRYSLAFICPVSCVLYVASFSRLSFVFSLRYSLTFICPVSCVPYVASFFGVSFFYFPFGIL